LSSLPTALLDTAAYPHAVADITLIETHMSWVFLTGEYVYKVKKPIHFDFVDFSSLTRRRYFCEEEVRCNRTFAPQLYLGVVPIMSTVEGDLYVGDPRSPADVVVDYAVHMKAFAGECQADRLLARGELQLDEMRAFGARLAVQHQALPELDIPYSPQQAIFENFTTLQDTQLGQRFASELDALHAQAREQVGQFGEYLQTRQRQHYVRECHGDLHLSNLARLDSGITAFDCLEFDQDLRNIDIWCDSGFLFMDCCVRERADLAYAFVDGYLDVSVDYAGLQLLPMFAAYRSVVRAKIAALRYDQVQDEQVMAKLQLHLQWPLQQARRPTGRLWITCGLSGSGKSFWAKQLVATLPALRIRSDLQRKSMHGLTPLDASDSGVGAGMYDRDKSINVYKAMAQHAVNLLNQGEDVIIDAACLRRDQRDILYRTANEAGAAASLLYFTATEATLQARIQTRAEQGDDPSEADTSVLAWQMDHFEYPLEEEKAIHLDTENLSIDRLMALLER
jgi:uncharacterized protein